MLHTLQKPWGKRLCIGLTLRQNISKLQLKPTLKLYKKHKNFYSKFYKKEIRKYYESLDMKNILDSKGFWKMIFLFDKSNFDKSRLA